MINRKESSSPLGIGGTFLKSVYEKSVSGSLYRNEMLDTFLLGLRTSQESPQSHCPVWASAGPSCSCVGTPSSSHPTVLFFSPHFIVSPLTTPCYHQLRWAHLPGDSLSHPLTDIEINHHLQFLVEKYLGCDLRPPKPLCIRIPGGWVCSSRWLG